MVLGYFSALPYPFEYMPLQMLGVEPLLSNKLTYPALQMCGDYLPEPTVEELPMFVQDDGVCIPVQLLETQTRVVLVLNLLKNIEKFSLATLPTQLYYFADF